MRYHTDNPTKEGLPVYTMRHVRGHIEVYGADGTFLFSADSEQEARAMMEE